MAMSVSRPHLQTPIVPKGPGPLGSVPPFWELEDLLIDGLELAGALSVMAARRTAPVLVQSASGEPRATRLMFAFGPADRFH
jgi:hypothetical protein